ncbi:hypothetical protein MJO28_015190 [Puccinia striiformis f. sp. tritici]|uniref:Uncharacterized protein n=1 Tax=Puccinia striiformis f. sp. tritici TaxID=168172 RepID=A0ACC0DRV0_9BASI|nr:hypothetical protein MJO28_015190 [Puccinia striiformis f. sp. tritici]
MLNLALLHAQSCSPPSSLCLPHLSTLQRLTPSPSLLCNILPCGPPHCNCAINDHKSSKRDESKQDPSIVSIPLRVHIIYIRIQRTRLFERRWWLPRSQFVLCLI